MVNVLQLIDSFHQGGTERQVVQLTRMLHERQRYKVHIACLNPDGPLRADLNGLGFNSIPEFPLTSFYDRNAVVQLRRMRAFLRDNRIDLVHAHDFYTNIFGMTAAVLARVPVRIASRRETEGIRSPSKRWLEHRAYRSAHAVVANAEVIRQQLISEGLPEGKVVTIYNGMDFERVSPRIGFREKILAELGIPFDSGRRLVTIVANMRHPMKDQAMFLRAARRVKDVVAEAAFVLAGEGEQMPSLRVQAGELGLDPDVLFMGRCARVADLLSVSEICVLSSKGVEGFSNSILEYMAASRPVVATDIGGAREAVIDGETGFVVPPEADEAMADRIIHLLQNPDSARRMGENGLRDVRKKFSCEQQLERVENLYDRLLGLRAGSQQSAKGGVGPGDPAASNDSGQFRQHP